MEYTPTPTVVYQKPRSQKSYVEATVDAGKKVTELFRGGLSWMRGTELPPPVEHPDMVKITCAKFVDLELVPDKMTPCLIFGSNKGFEVWDLTHAGKDQPGGTEKITELVCQLEQPIQQIYALPRHPEVALSPMIAYVTAEKPDTLAIRSLGCPSDQVYYPVGFGEHIVNVLANQRAIVVVGSSHCVLIDPVSWRIRYRIPIYHGIEDREQQINTTGCVALGSRFLAFQSQPGPRRRVSAGLNSSVQGTSLLQSAAAAATSAKFLVSGTETRESPPGGGEITIIDLEIATREESDYFKRDQTESTLIDVYDEPDVVRRDEPIENHFRIISKFVVDGGYALSAIEFDPSGALLAAATGNGMGLTIYPVMCSAHYHPTISVKPILSLQRGVTAAVIKHISFSLDSSLIECVSNHRTTHIWAPRADFFEHSACNLSSPIPTEKLKSSSLSREPFSNFGGVNHILPRDSVHYKMLNFDDSGILSLYYLKVAPTTDSQGKTGHAWNITPSKHEWNILEDIKDPMNHRKRENYLFRQQRENGQPIQHSIFKPEAGSPGNSHWYSEVEYQTCSITIDRFREAMPMPSWKNPSMTVKINRAFDDPRYKDAPLIPHQESIFAKIEWEDVSNSKVIQGNNNGQMDDLGISKYVWPNPI